MGAAGPAPTGVPVPTPRPRGVADALLVGADDSAITAEEECMTGRDPGADVFATRFSDALRERGMTLSELSKRLSGDGNPVSLATLSYWRSGGRQPGEASIPIVDSIEGILGCPSARSVDVPLARPHLRARVPAPRARARVPAAVSPRKRAQLG